MRVFCFLVVMLSIASVCDGQSTTDSGFIYDQDAYSSQRKFDFGDVSIGKDAVHEFLIANPHQETMKISSIGASCGCTIVSSDSMEIAPGEATKLIVKLDTQRFQGKRSSAIQVRVAEPVKTEIQFSISCHIRNLLIEPAVVQFAGDNAEERKQQIKITRRGSSFWKIKKLTTSDESVTAKIVDSKVKPQQVTYTLECSLNGSGSTQMKTVELALSTNDSSQPTVLIPVLINVSGPIVASPSQIVFKAHHDKPQSKKVIVKTEEPTKLVRMESGDERLIFEEIQPSSSRVHIVEVTLAKNSEPLQATVLIEDDNTQKLEIQINVSE